MPPEPSFPCTTHCWCHRGVASEGQGQLSMALGHQHGFTWPLVVTWPTDINIDLYCGRAMVPDLALCSSIGPDITVAFGASAGLSCQAVPHCRHLSSSGSLYRTYSFASFSPISSPCICSPYRCHPWPLDVFCFVQHGCRLVAGWLQAGLMTSLRLKKKKKLVQMNYLR